MSKPKGRAAGSGSHYTISVVDAQGNVRGHGIQLPSVTTILGKGMPKDANAMSWYGYKVACKAVAEYTASTEAKAALDDGELLYDLLKTRKKITPYTELKAAGNRGTQVHDYAESLLRTGQLQAAPEGLEGYYAAVEAWYDHENIGDYQPIVIEEPLFSIKHSYAGTVDYIGLAGDIGVQYVIDFKTSSAIHKSHLVQLAAYEQAAIEMGLLDVDMPVEKQAVRLGADGAYQIVASDYTIEDFLVVKTMYEVIA